MSEEIVATNYWKELHKELNQTIENLRGLILLTHNSVEFSDIVDFLNKIKSDQQQTLLYISLINSYKHIKSVLEKNPLKSKKINVVDCVSGFLLELQDEIDCVYRSPPRNLEGMKDIIIKNINHFNPNIVIVDSLSQFINFTTPKDSELHELYKFLKTIKSDAMGITNDTIVMLYDDKMRPLKKLPTIFTDMILKLEVIKEDVDWKD